MIHSVGAGFIKVYLAMRSKQEITPDDLVKILSEQMGEQGTKITKKQLDAYIKKLESADPSDENTAKINVLKQLRDNCTIMAKGDEQSATFNPRENVPLLLAATMSGVFSGPDTTDVKTSTESSKKTLTESIYGHLKATLNLSSDEDIKKTDLASYLKELIANPSPEQDSTAYTSVDSNDETIAALTNMIADFSSKSTVEHVA